MIALVFCGDIKYCPYIKRYIDEIEKSGSDYRVYFWNRGGFQIDMPAHYHYYNVHSELKKNKVSKLLDFLGFRKWLMSELQKDNPNGIIALSTLTGILMGSYLYKGDKKYIFDIRDYSYEHIKLFYKIEEKIIYNSFFTAISSGGFRAFLPEHQYVIAHNFNRNDIVDDTKFQRKDGVITFVWNGVVRYFEYQKQYLDALKNDHRFEMVFHGDGPDLALYKKYCADNGFENVTFTGSYQNSNKAQILANACILNNCYGYTTNPGNKLKYAVSNRFYDGMIYHIPQLVELEGYKTEQTVNSGIGVAIAPDNNFANKLYDYYATIDSTAFDSACERILEQVVTEDNTYIASITSFIRSVEMRGGYITKILLQLVHNRTSLYRGCAA